MDLWNLLLKRAFSISSLDYCLLGRWLRHMPGGTLRHASILAAAPKPSLGLGGAASRTPNPAQARLKSIATHAVFGIGLYICACGVSYVLRIH
jgi:hypothetical protein